MIASELQSWLNQCKTLNQIKQTHAHLLTNALTHLHSTLTHHLLLSPPPHAPSHLTLLYARQLFDQIPHPHSSTWTSFLRHLSAHRRFPDAIALYARMHCAAPRPTTFTLSVALKACARAPNNWVGLSIHAQVVKYGFTSDVYANTALLDFYSKLGVMEAAEGVFYAMPERNVVSWNSFLFGYLKAGELAKARRVFDEMVVKDVVSWNSMISGYAKGGDIMEAKSLFERMPERNSASWNSMIGGYADVGEMEEARRLFEEMQHRSSVSWIAMISGYSRCGDVESAHALFDRIETKDLLSWNAMISCYAQNNRGKEAIELFNRMRMSDVNIQPDEMTFSCVLSACSQLGDLKFGLWVETYMKQIGVQLDDHLATALIDLYAKCGCIDKAYELFHGLRKKDVVAYTALILGCGINGKAMEAIKYFKEMLSVRIRPNAVTYTGILTAYNHAGLVEEGYRCFSSMLSEQGLMPTSDHYGIVVDLLGRAGRLEEAHQLIMSMPMQPHAGVWGALLLACRLHCNVELAEIATQHCVELEPDPSGYYSLLANIYASAERWDDAKRLRRVMEENKLTKVPGCSWMEST